MLVLNLSAFESKKYAAYYRFRGNGPYGEIPTLEGPMGTLGFALPYNNTGYSPVFAGEYLKPENNRSRDAFRKLAPEGKYFMDFKHEICQSRPPVPADGEDN